MAARDAESGTRVYSPAQVARLREDRGELALATVSVVDGSTQSVARQLAASGPVTLLNFASARNVGGGFINGAKAQEEDLCRCSALYPCLESCTDYYETNRNQSSMLYTDAMIHSPEVPFFKVRGRGDYLAEPFTASVITAPAPNSAPYLERHPDGRDELRATFLRRWRNVLSVARHESARRLLLGAWGCGAFGGDPAMAADTAAEAIASHGGGLLDIVFAIPNRGKAGQRNYAAFRERLA